MARFLFVVAAMIVTAAFFSGSAPAQACVGINCGDPVAVERGQSAPIWQVAYCIIGPADGQHEQISCQDPRAVHVTPTGNEGVCFIGTDGKAHWDYQSVVFEGREFFNHRINGLWQPHWRPRN